MILLIIDDYIVDVKVISQWIQEENPNIKIYHAESVDDAQKKLVNHTDVQVVISDYYLKASNETAEDVREMLEITDRDLPMIVVTGCLDSLQRRENLSNFPHVFDKIDMQGDWKNVLTTAKGLIDE